MDKITGTTITIIVAVLTLCCSAACCASGIYTTASGGQWSDVLNTYVEWYYGLPVICLGILVWLVPVLLWIFLVRGKTDRQ
jgi:hypothetical protein